MREENGPPENTATYLFTVSSNGTMMETVIKIAPNFPVSGKCSCGNKFPCSHVHYILAGKTTRLRGITSIENQSQLLRMLQGMPEALPLLKRSRKIYAGEQYCRRCNSSKIVKIKQSISARIFSFLKGASTHTYYCKKCKWTW